RTGPGAVGLAGLLSAMIELSQIVIPGRDPSLGDVCFNTLGAAVGQVTTVLAVRLAVPSPEERAARFSFGSALAVVVVTWVTGWRPMPLLPASTLRAWYSPARPDLEQYRGRVIRSSLGSTQFRTSEVPNPATFGRSFLSGDTLRLLAIAGPRTPALGPLL